MIGVAAANSRSTTDAPKAAPAVQTTGFVGDETCSTCHDSQAKGLHETLHGKAQNSKTPAAKNGQACETCHGAGQKHVESGNKADIKRFNALSARDANDACLSCHAKNASHVEFQGSMHDARNVSCVTCHSVHNPKSAKAQLKTVSATETCESCHKQEAMKVKKAGHMPVREGKMECTSCHTPHGSTNVRMLKVGNTINEACASCHAEKRGPYLWEHAAGKENCASCHDPHGSNNDRMLVAKAPMLCQRCHISSRHPPTIYDGAQLTAASNRMVGRSCVNCHSQIHGSNSPSGMRFLR
ncbi:MAG TPA: DmsE family decaheme c-type cytochrome [Vicinamibacterales bacterium]|nr:DmsE family decaheme c-type cytochrome [Vicinamibacterales bacterium]